MPLIVATGITTSIATTVKTSNLAIGTYQFLPKGRLTLIAKQSAAGLLATLISGGVTIVQDQPIPYFGSTGSMSVNDNVMCSQVTPGGQVELYFRNPTGGTLTVDYQLNWDAA